MAKDKNCLDADLLEGGSEEGASGSEDDGRLPDGEDEDILEAAGEDGIRY